MILHSYDFFAPTLLIYTYLPLIPASFLFYIKLWGSLSNLLMMVPKHIKWIANESNFPSFLSLCVFILGHRLGKCPNNLCKYQCILTFPVTYWGMILIWKFRWCKKNAKRNFVFAVHMADLIPTYAFRAIPLT